MSKETKDQVLARLRRRYARAGRQHKQQLLDQAVELLGYLGQRPRPVLLSRCRPYHKNDNAHVEQRNWTHVRQHFGYERYDNPAVVPLINALCKGPLGQLLNHFLPTQQLREKRRVGRRWVRVYGPAQTPYARVLAAPEVGPEQKAQLAALHRGLNPFQLARQIEQGQREIAARRQLCP